MAEAPRREAQRLCRDLLRYSAILALTTDAQAIRALRALISETEERVFALEDAAERDERCDWGASGGAALDRADAQAARTVLRN